MLEPLAVLDGVGVLRVGPVLERAALGGQLVARPLRAVVDAHHELAGDLVADVRAVADAELDVELGEAHHAEADLPVAVDRLLDPLDREVRHRDDVLEEPGAPLDPAVELVEVDRLLEERLDGRLEVGVVVGLPVRPDPPVGAVEGGEGREVDVAEVAGLVLHQRLLAAGVRREDLVLRAVAGRRRLDREGVLLVDAVEVDHAGLAVLPGAVDDALPDGRRRHRELLARRDVLVEAVPGVHLLGVLGRDVGLARARVDERELLVVPERLHELVGDADGDVEVREVALDGVPEVLGDAALLVDELPGLLEGLVEGRVGVVVGVVQPERVGQRDVLVLRVDELDDVRVRDPHDGHLGAPPGAALGDGLAHLVERLHERDRARGDAAGRADRVAVGAEPPERVAHPAAGLEHLGGLHRGLVDVGEVVLRRVDEARRELLELVAGVHQRRRVRDERQRLHLLGELRRDRLDVLADLVGELGDDGLPGELVDVVLGERGLDVVVDGRPGAEDLRGELVAARVVGLDLVGRDGQLDAAALGLVDRLGQGDVPGDPDEQLLLGLGELALVVAAEVAGRQDVVVGVAGQAVLERVAGGPLARDRQLVGGQLGRAHRSVPRDACPSCTGDGESIIVSIALVTRIGRSAATGRRYDAVVYLSGRRVVGGAPGSAAA